MKSQSKLQKTVMKKTNLEIEWVFYRALASLLGFLFLIQCLWANMVVMVFAALVGTLCLAYGLYPRGT